MKRLLTSTTALSLAFAPMSSLPLAAQVAVDTPEGTAFCLAVEADPCPDGEVCFLAEGGDCAAPEIEAAAALALLDAAEDDAAEADAGADASADAAAPAASGVAEDAVEDQTVEPTEDQSDAAPAAEDAAEVPTPAPAGEADGTQTQDTAQDPDAVPDTADAPADTTTAAEETAVPTTPEAEAAPTSDAEPTGETTAGEEAAPQDLVTEVPETAEVVEEGATGAASDSATAETEEATGEVTAGDEPSAQDTVTELPETPEVVEDSATDATSDSATADAEEAAEARPEIVGEAASVLQDILGAGADAVDGEAPTAAAAAAGVEGQTAGADPATAPAVNETEITEENSRSSSEEFAPTATATAGAESSGGLSDLERFGLVALGALAVGAILKNGDQVVSNTGDRVVVEDDRGEFRVLKDDDTLLRRPGSRLRTETFNDGSTRSTLARDDGSSIVTIRDASGRVLRRARYAADGTELVLIDDLQQFERIDVATLPPPPAPRDQTVISASQSPADLAVALAAIEARENARAYSLRQIREYREVRALAPTIDVESITFPSGSAAIEASEAEKLSTLGRLIAGVLEDRPYEIFLVEGHTDAVGSAPSNLALSDRRAESVALALTEYFGIPPENLVVQGYGEAELRIPTQTAEERNRRAAVRLISPLLRTAASR